MVEMYCLKCEKRVGYVTTGQKLALKAFISDMSEESIKLLKPPLKTKQVVSNEDHNFLKEMGIKDEE